MADRPWQFVPFLMKYMQSLKFDLGTDIFWADKQTYNLALMGATLHAMTLKILQDLHPDVVTDEALLQRLLTAIDTGPEDAEEGKRGLWPGWLVDGVAPELLAQYGADETTTVAELRQKIYDYNHPEGGI